MESTEIMMPTIFIGHGSPMNAIENNMFSMEWAKFGSTLPKPKAILSISAHWETNGIFITSNKFPKTIHDFSGFPKELYEFQYPAEGVPELARQIQNLFPSKKVELTENWGIDHGTWSVLCHIFPKADIPVLQISMDLNASVEEHFSIGKKLRELRRENILILGSGNLVHSFKYADFSKGMNAPYGLDWAIRANEKIKNFISNQDLEILDFQNKVDEIAKAIPTPEHFLPAIYIMGTRFESDKCEFWNDHLTGGSFSMTCFTFTN